MHRLAPLAVVLALGLPPEPAPTPSPTPSNQPPTNLDLRMIRFKISAGDLYSAESILEWHKADKGEDAEYVLGMAWLARGAALLGDWTAAGRYAKAARELAAAKLKGPADYEENPEAVYALGTAIEVEAQSLVAAGKTAEAIRLLEESARAQEKAPYNLRARIWKRRNQIELVGKAAPGFRVEDHLGADFKGLESLRGKPVVLFLWWESCGDCRMEAPALKRTIEKYAPRGVVFVAPTRFYDKASAEEKAKIAAAWKDVYGAPEGVAVPISDDGMLRYGVSATPTFVFVDRKGIVTAYLPYRMTDERLSEKIEALLR